jgi:molybdate transport system substrate-binding protein
MPLLKIIFLLFLIGFTLTSGGEVSAVEKQIMAFCGSASKPAIEEACRVFKKNTGIKVDLHFSGSGTMLSQMKMSRRGDLYIPGSPDYMLKAERQGLVAPESFRIIAYLVPAIDVLHSNPKGIKGLSDLARPGIRVGIGNPEAVCVGLYAIEVLEKNGLLDRVQKNIITHAPSCSATAGLLVMEKVDAVIGWRVFSKWRPDKISAVLLKPETVPRLAYIPAALSTYCRDRKSSQTFLDFLTLPVSKTIFRKWGYITTIKDARAFAPNARIGGEYQLPEAFIR